MVLTIPKPPKQVQDRYDNIIRKFLDYGRKLPSLEANNSVVSVNQIAAQFLRWAATQYDDPQKRELDAFKVVIRILRETCGLEPAANFSPKKLKLVREKMIGLKWCRNVINRRVQRVKMIFGWGTEEELVPPSVYHGLLAIRGTPA
jgi:hypothetical protein